jgi:4-carboxymuconolactone decarboxylase
MRLRRLLLLPVVLFVIQAQPQAQRINTPRIKPIEPSEWTAEHREILGARAASGNARDTFKICLRNPDLCRSWLPFTTYVESDKSSLPKRDRELLIMRTAFLCGNDPTWGPHEGIARRLGYGDKEIHQIVEGPRAAGWSPFEAAVLQAADDLHKDQFIQDATWKALAEKYDDRQLMDTIFAVGQYTMISMYLNSVGAQLGPNDKKLPKP